MKNVLLFGSNGSIGNYIYNKFLNLDEFNIYGTTSEKKNKFIHIDCFDENTLINLDKLDNLDIIIWCQGININNTIENLEMKKHLDIMNCNCNFIIETLNYLLKKNKINKNGKLCIISSIWEKCVRDNKFSYCVSKSALEGLVKSISIDLSYKNILINNILPGPIDNNMTRTMLTKEQYNKVCNYTGFNRLVSLEDIYELVYYLCIINKSITGQSITIDLSLTNYIKI